METTEKTCFKCNRRFTLDKFYKHPMMGDGHLNKCKECTKKDTKANKAANYDYYANYDRERAKLPHRKEAMAKRLPDYRRQNPERYAAHRIVNVAVKSGFLKPMPCLICGAEKTEAHHPDYSSPLDVVWLCSRHHKEAHAIAYYVSLEAA